MVESRRYNKIPGFSPLLGSPLGRLLISLSRRFIQIRLSPQKTSLLWRSTWHCNIYAIHLVNCKLLNKAQNQDTHKNPNENQGVRALGDGVLIIHVSTQNCTMGHAQLQIPLCRRPSTDVQLEAPIVYNVTYTIFSSCWGPWKASITNGWGSCEMSWVRKPACAPRSIDPF